MQELPTNTGAVQTTCPYCGVGCGVLASVAADGSVQIRGDETHPANRGRLCSKGSALGETLGLAPRLLFPEIRGQRVPWDAALETVATELKRIVNRHGPDAIAFYLSGQLLTEDYYVANKLMKGFLGSGNVDTNSRLCMSSAVAGHQRAFGSDTVPCDYADLEQADLLVLVGSNIAWCHPVLFQRICAAKAERGKPKVVVIDPRRTATCDIADLHLAIQPGADGILFNGLLNFLRREDALDWDFLETHTEGVAAAMRAAREGSANIPAMADACGLSADAIGQFFHWFARTTKTVTVFSQGINQSATGTDKVNSILNCHLATGRIGQPGMGPFSLTGQPNAMGGREVGGLATALAAHMDFALDNVERVARFWNAPRMAKAPGLKAIELFRAIGRGQIKALWIMATNPMVSLPDSDGMREALRRCGLVIVSDCVRRTDTTRLAHVLFPACAWGEKSGTVTNSERCISRNRPFLPAPGEAKPDWWIVTEVAQRLGFEPQFPYQNPADIFREHAQLSGFENGGTRDFDISALSELPDAAYETLAPISWPIGPKGASQRPFADGQFFTMSGKARLVAVSPRPPANPPSEQFPLVLNTGRIRDQWHTMTRTAESPRLNAHTPEPIVQVHPQDATRFGLAARGLARVYSRWGAVIVRVSVTPEQRPGSVFVPMHWSDVFAGRARIGAVVNPATDPVSGEPEFKHTPVAIAPYQPDWYGFVLSRQPVAFDTGLARSRPVSRPNRAASPPAVEYWALVRGDQHRRYEFAGCGQVPDWPAWTRLLLGTDGDWLDFEDRAAHRYRGAKLGNQQLQACLFVAPSPELPARAWLGSLFAKGAIDNGDRMHLLAGRPPQGMVDSGPTVCACFNIGLNTLRETIQRHRLTTSAAVGAALSAGTNCGSCIPEIDQVLAEALDTLSEPVLTDRLEPA